MPQHTGDVHLALFVHAKDEFRMKQMPDITSHTRLKQVCINRKYRNFFLIRTFIMS